MNDIDRDDVESIIGYFDLLPDPRDTRNRRHLLVDIIVISVCGVIVGCEGPTAIERWAKAKRDWLGEFLELPNGIPSHDTFNRVFAATLGYTKERIIGKSTGVRIRTSSSRKARSSCQLKRTNWAQSSQ